MRPGADGVCGRKLVVARSARRGSVGGVRCSRLQPRGRDVPYLVARQRQEQMGMHAFLMGLNSCLGGLLL